MPLPDMPAPKRPAVQLGKHSLPTELTGESNGQRDTKGLLTIRNDVPQHISKAVPR